MARRIDHNRYTSAGKLRFNAALLLGGLLVIPLARLLCMTQAGAILGAPLYVAGPILCVTAIIGMAHTSLQAHYEVVCPECNTLHKVERGVNSFLCTNCGARVGNIPRGYNTSQ